MDVEAPRTRSSGGEKRLRKRKELDAMVANMSRMKKGGPSSELLGSDTSDADDRTALHETPDTQYKFPVTFIPRHTVWHNVCVVVTVFACLVSMFTILWLHVQMKVQIGQFRQQLSEVLEEKQHMSDNNHFFRTRIEELSNNQTELKLNMSIVQKQITSLSSQLLSLNSSLSLVVSNWASVPQLETLPSEVEAVKRNVASFGSSLTDLQTQVAEIGSTVGNQTRDIKSIRQTLSSPQSTGAPPALVDSATVARQIELSNRTDILKDNVVELSRSVQEIQNIIGEKFKKQEEQDDQDLKLINRLKDDVQNVSARAETNRNECQALKLSVDELDQRVGGIEKKVEGKEDDKKVEKRSTREKSFDEEKEMSFTAEETDEDDEYYRR